mgnify:CR=1 FL=1
MGLLWMKKQMQRQIRGRYFSFIWKIPASNFINLIYAYERLLLSGYPCFSFILVMKDILICFAPAFVLHHRYEGHFLSRRPRFCPSSPLWRTFPSSVLLLLSFITTMKDIFNHNVLAFVFHHRYEGHSLSRRPRFCPSSPPWKTFPLPVPSLLSFITAMKDIFSPGALAFVLHQHYEGHFLSQCPHFCLSSPPWKTFPSSVLLLLSFIATMKDIPSPGALAFVLHQHYEGHFHPRCSYFCPSSPLWRTFLTTMSSFLSFITAMKDISTPDSPIFVLHHHHERHFLSQCFHFCLSSLLWKTFPSSLILLLSFIAASLPKKTFFLFFPYLCL